jgi:hypothetical protein
MARGELGSFSQDSGDRACEVEQFDTRRPTTFELGEVQQLLGQCLQPAGVRHDSFHEHPRLHRVHRVPLPEQHGGEPDDRGNRRPNLMRRRRKEDRLHLVHGTHAFNEGLLLSEGLGVRQRRPEQLAGRGQSEQIGAHQRIPGHHAQHSQQAATTGQGHRERPAGRERLWWGSQRHHAGVGRRPESEHLPVAGLAGYTQAEPCQCQALDQMGRDRRHHIGEIQTRLHHRSKSGDKRTVSLHLTLTGRGRHVPAEQERDACRDAAEHAEQRDDP